MAHLRWRPALDDAARMSLSIMVVAIMSMAVVCGIHIGAHAASRIERHAIQWSDARAERRELVD